MKQIVYVYTFNVQIGKLQNYYHQHEVFLQINHQNVQQ